MIEYLDLNNKLVDTENFYHACNYCGVSIYTVTQGVQCTCKLWFCSQSCIDKHNQE